MPLEGRARARRIVRSRWDRGYARFVRGGRSRRVATCGARGAPAKAIGVDPVTEMPTRRGEGTRATPQTTAHPAHPSQPPEAGEVTGSPCPGAGPSARCASWWQGETAWIAASDCCMRAPQIAMEAAASPWTGTASITNQSNMRGRRRRMAGILSRYGDWKACPPWKVKRLGESRFESRQSGHPGTRVPTVGLQGNYKLVIFGPGWRATIVFRPCGSKRCESFWRKTSFMPASTS